MAFDGLAIASIRQELENTIVGGRLYKIAQPETDELLLTIKSNSGQYRLVLSANSTLPLIYLTEENKPSPLTAPNFCMLLRKHLGNGRIVAVTQPGLERIIDIEIEHLDELGDLCRKHLVIEIMGKHSNIIFLENNIILDSIKRINASLSSVREVLPGREYFIPNTADKLNPLNTDFEEFVASVCTKPMSLQKALYQTYTGISPAAALEIIARTDIDADMSANCLDEADKHKLYMGFEQIINIAKTADFTPCIAYDDGTPSDFSAIPITLSRDVNYFTSISQVIREYYSKKETVTRIRQKSSDLRKILTNSLERAYKKEDIQTRQLESTKNRDDYRIYGELINTYGYSVPEGAKSFTALNYYTNEDIEIPLDETLSVKDNAIKYFNRYNKLKRTYEAGIVQLEDTKSEIAHLESILTALDIALNEEDLIQIKLELSEAGYIRHKLSNKKLKITSKPFHYISSDGFHIYVGKNNYQNDELTFKFARNDDWWFHAKDMAGSHVILRSEGRSQEEIPDRAFEEAAALAAYYSKGQDQEKVEIDYVIKKEVKKPAAAKPGFVVYYTNYSLIASTDISKLKQA